MNTWFRRTRCAIGLDYTPGHSPRLMLILWWW